MAEEKKGTDKASSENKGATEPAAASQQPAKEPFRADKIGPGAAMTQPRTPSEAVEGDEETVDWFFARLTRFTLPNYAVVEYPPGANPVPKRLLNPHTERWFRAHGAKPLSEGKK